MHIHGCEHRPTPGAEKGTVRQKCTRLLRRRRSSGRHALHLLHAAGLFKNGLVFKGADQAVGDLLGLQELDQVGPGNRDDRTVPFISYRTRNFPESLKVPASGHMPVSQAELIWAAVTVGATPISMGGTPRPLLELAWRGAMAAASLEVDPSSDRWVKTAAYRRLDASERAAVSYFLGMLQAKITCARLMGAPHLVHLDAYLSMIGMPQGSRSRPDLVGVNMPSMDSTIAVEAKGAFGRRRSEVIRKAKEQLTRLPEVPGGSTALRVASVASFDARDRWAAYLEDPPAAPQERSPLAAARVLAAYYQPLVASVLDAAGNVPDQEEQMIFGRIQGIDLTLGIPTPIARVMAPPMGGERAAVGELLVARAVVRDTLLSRIGASNTEDDADLTSSRSYTGLDGVRVELGPTWQ